MSGSWKFLLLGIVGAVVAGVILEWLNTLFNSPAVTASQISWEGQLAASSLPNLNQAPQSPASAYQSGAPVTNYRSYVRVGILELPAQ